MRMDWWTYVQRTAGQASAREISRRTGIGQTSVNRWQHASPKPENVATFARTYQRPILEAFVAAGFLTEEEAQTEVPADVKSLPTDDLVGDLHRLADELARRARD